MVLVTRSEVETDTRPIKIQAVSIEPGTDPILQRWYVCVPRHIQPRQAGVAALSPAMTPSNTAAVNTSAGLAQPSS